jgi:hypothetical protein
LTWSKCSKSFSTGTFPSRSNNKYAMQPLQVAGRCPFIVTAAHKSAEDQDVPVCNLHGNLCDPPSTTGKTSWDQLKISRAVRNQHAAAHQLHIPPAGGEHCGLCCKMQGCRVAIKIMRQLRTGIEQGHCKIPSKSVVEHNCVTFPRLENFAY